LQPLSATGITQLTASVIGNVPNARRAATEISEASSGILQRLGLYTEARQLCLATLAQLPDYGPARDPHCRRLQQQLAILTAFEGDCSSARESLTALLAAEAATVNPLTLGSLHHDLAVVAIIASAREDFLSHASAAEHHYRVTGNGSLLARHERPLARARRAGLLSGGGAPRELDDDDDVAASCRQCFACG
jgi:hypothetical protein